MPLNYNTSCEYNFLSLHMGLGVVFTARPLIKSEVTNKMTRLRLSLFKKLGYDIKIGSRKCFYRAFHDLVNTISSATPAMHRWELPGNYPVFIVVMAIYHYVERIWRIIVTPNLLYNIYIR